MFHLRLCLYTKNDKCTILIRMFRPSSDNEDQRLYKQ
jgi:hypothetical protein